MKQIAYIVGVLTVIMFIATKHFALVLFIMVMFIIYSYDRKLNVIKKELSWISKCLVDEEEYKTIKARKQFYDLIFYSIANGNIRIGMSLDKINAYIKDSIKGYSQDIREGLEFRKSIHFKSFAKKGNIVLDGFGDNIPTPKLILKIREGKLIDAKGDSIEFMYAVKKYANNQLSVSN